MNSFFIAVSQSSPKGGEPSGKTRSFFMMITGIYKHIGRGKGVSTYKQGKTKWLLVTIVQKKSPVTYLVKLGSLKRLSCGSFAV